MKSLKDVEPETMVVVKEITGGLDVKQHLEELGLKEGAEITLLRKETPPPTPKRGTYILAKVGEQLITIGHGLAEKVLVE